MKTIRTLIRIVATLSVAMAASAPSAMSWAATPAHSSGGGITRAGHGVASLGDSVAAGYFAGPADRTNYATKCGRTTSAYGYQVGRITGRTVHVLACVGATSAVGLLAPKVRVGAGPFKGADPLIMMRWSRRTGRVTAGPRPPAAVIATNSWRMTVDGHLP